MGEQGQRSRSWLTRGALGICVATFFSDVGHEMATAVLPLYLGAIGLGPAALGAVEGFADLVYASAKLAGGYAGQRIQRKAPWVAAGYALTAIGTAAMAFVRVPAALGALRATAWAGRGFRSPLRDHLLADEVEPTHYGRVYGIERAADMLGAVVGPLLAILLIAVGLTAGEVIGWTILPALVPVLAIALFVRDRGAEKDAALATASPPLPPAFWRLIRAVSLFGVSDFSRTFLILLAARALGGSSGASADVATGFGTGSITAAVALYALHNALSAVAALGLGRLADRFPKPRLLAAGYAVGAATHAILAFGSESLAWLVAAIVLSSVYVAAEETLEKATCAALVPRASRSKAFGLLAGANSLGDLASSVGIGLALQFGHGRLGFAICAALAGLGALVVARVESPPPASPGLS